MFPNIMCIQPVHPFLGGVFDLLNERRHNVKISSHVRQLHATGESCYKLLDIVA